MLDPQVTQSGGEMGALMRAFDWARTPLGPVESWPASLRTAVTILLSTRHPMFLWWGPELIQFYNDGYRLSLGLDRHPSALGARGRECWAEIWHIIGPEVDSIMAGGPATWHEDHLVPITRGDRVEDVYWSYSYSPLPDDAGKVGGVLVTVQETTQRVLAERRKQMLRELGERLNATRSVDAVCAASASVLETNPPDLAFALMYFPGDAPHVFRRVCAAGLTPESTAAPGNLLDSAEHPWPLARILKESAPFQVIDVPADVGPIHRELWPEPVRQAILSPLGSPGGARGVLIVGASPRLILDGNYQAFLVDIAQMITTALDRIHAREQERQAELQARDAQRLQSIGALAGGVAHEVNNQMTVVLGLGGFVLKALGPSHPQADDMRTLMDAGARAARISQQLLTFTRQQFTQPRRLELPAVIGAFEPMLRSLLGNDKTLILGPDPGAWPISADLTQVEQVLIDLITNARDATPPGGRVTISIENVALTDGDTAERGVVALPGRYVLLSVTDTGKGMDQGTVARVFEPFFTTKPVGQGTGLGLSMVYGIVKRHEGYIWVESAPRRGTTMRLYWPALAAAPRDASSEAERPPQERQESDRPRRVWVVEDETSVRELLARTLAEEGLRVLTADDGGDALRLLEEEVEAPDVVVTDLVMPYVTGRQVSDAIAARYPEVPVLFMSGYAVDDVVHRGLMPANAAFLQKPFTPEQLVQALEAMLAQTR